MLNVFGSAPVCPPRKLLLEVQWYNLMLEPPQPAAFDLKEAAAADIKKEAAFVIFLIF